MKVLKNLISKILEIDTSMIKEYNYVPAYIIHEMSHFILLLFPYMLGMNTFPTLKTNYPRKEILNDGRTVIHSINGSVNYNIYRPFNHSFIYAFVSIAPAISFFLILFFCPLFIKVYMIMTIRTSWMSPSDTDKFLYYFKLRKRFKRVRRKNKRNSK